MCGCEIGWFNDAAYLNICVPLLERERVTGEQFLETESVKGTEQNDKLKRAIIISAVLHVILFAALIWSSFDENIEASAEAAVVRPSTLSWLIQVR